MRKLYFLVFILFLTAEAYPQWVQTNGPYGGNIEALVVSGTKIFAAAGLGGVFVSTNNGESWSAVNHGLQNTSVWALAARGSNLFAGTWGDGVFRSTNCGETWSAINNGLMDMGITCLAIMDTILYAGTVGGAYLSVDNGMNWSRTDLPAKAVKCFTINGEILFAGVDQAGVYCSTDKGTTWTPVGFGNSTVWSLAVDGTNLYAATEGWDKGVYFSTDSGMNWTQTSLVGSVRALMVSGTNLYAGVSDEGVARSTDHGTSWTYVNTGLPVPTEVKCFAELGMSLFAGMHNVFGSAEGIFRTTNNGTSWTEVNSGLTSNGATCLEVIGDNLIANTGRGVFLSTNSGTTWESRNSGLPHAGLNGIYRLAVSGTNLLAGGYYCGVFLSTDSGANWEESNAGLLSRSVSTFAIMETSTFVASDSGVFLSTDNGASWKSVNTDVPLRNISAFGVSGRNLFASTFDGVFLSTDNGTSWTAAITPFTGFSDMLQTGANLFAGTGSGVFLSTDNGTSWTAVGLTNLHVHSLAISGSNLFAGIWLGGVFSSTDNGINWTPANTGLSNMRILDLAVSSGSLFVGTEGSGVLRRHLSEMIPVELASFTATANGKEVALNWSTATELNNQGFEVQRKFGSNDFATIGSVKGHGTTTSPNQYTYVDRLIDPGKYFYRLKQIDFDGKFEYSQTVEINWSPFITYKLEQNYPNPFNPTTTIGFGIPENGNVRLSILNILGEEIKILLNKEKEAGYHSIDFDASGLPSGVYFYQLKTGSYSETKKMLLLR